MSSYFLIRAGILPKPYNLLTVFDRSNWLDPMRRAAYRTLDTAEVTRIRRREDGAFATSLGLHMSFLGLADCLLREQRVYYGRDRELDPGLLKEMRALLAGFLKRRNITNIVAPFPAGRRQHYDHRLVREAVMSLPVRSYNVFFVDDVPYSRIPKPEAYQLRLVVRMEGKLQDKFKAMSIYDSQMCESYFDRVKKLSEQNRGYERLFVVSPDEDCSHGHTRHPLLAPFLGTMDLLSCGQIPSPDP